MPSRWPTPRSSHRDHDGVVGAAALALALGALVVGRAYGQVHGAAIAPRVTVWVAVVVMVGAGVVASRAIAAALGRRLTDRATAQAGGVAKLLVHGSGIVVLAFAVFAVLGVSAGRLLIGAGVAGVVLGIAAQQSFGNLFAALFLVVAHPFRVGEQIRIHSGVVGTIDVTVLDIGLVYVTVRTAEGELQIPNAAVLASGIGHPTPRGDDAAPPAVG